MRIRHGKNDTFLFPFTGVLPPNEGPRGGDTCPPVAAFSFRGTDMDEHATDRAPGTRVGQRHFLEPSTADTAAPAASRATSYVSGDVKVSASRDTARPAVSRRSVR